MNESEQNTPHRRLNALTNEWVLVSPQRTKRPWQGKMESADLVERPNYDPTCYLCPGNERAGGKHNPKYENTLIFENDFAALLPDLPELRSKRNEFFRTESVKGICRVICFSPDHSLTLPEMKTTDILGVVNVWMEQISELGRDFRWVQIFENKGEIMGCSNPHPHGQIWASDSIPNEPLKEETAQKEYFDKKGSVLLSDYLEEELNSGVRIVTENEHWAALVPYWAVWPFETMLIPKRNIQRLPEISEKEAASLADILKRHLTKYDNLFLTSFPYTMGWHGAPNDGKENEHWQLHTHFYPPLLRSATIKKFMVGYELLAEPQRDITAEQAAARLRELSEIHFKQKQNITGD